MLIAERIVNDSLRGSIPGRLPDRYNFSAGILLAFPPEDAISKAVSARAITSEFHQWGTASACRSTAKRHILFLIG